MGDFNIQAQIIENILQEYKVKPTEYKKLIDLLKQKSFSPFDLTLLEDYSEPFEEYIGDIMEMISKDALDSIGTKQFAIELIKLREKLKNKRDEEIMDKLVQFLENEKEIFYDTNLTKGLSQIAIKLDTYENQMLCVFTIRKIESLFMDE